MNVYGSYVAIAAMGGGLSSLIGIMSLKILTTITDTGMIAIALMTMAPAGMAVGIAYFIHRTHLAMMGQRETPAWPPPGGTGASPLASPPPISPPPYPDGGYTTPWRADR